MEPENALPYSQNLGPGTFLQPDESTPHHSIVFLADPFLFCFHIHLHLATDLFPLGFLTKILHTFM